MPITMQDVARHAGVSKATVSRVLNDVDGHVSPQTVERVKQAIKELGYVPNRVAANLKKKNSMNVGLVIADIINPFFAQITQGIEDVLQLADYSLILANTGNNPTRELRQIRVLMEQQVDALIIASSLQEVDASYFIAALDRDIYVILVNNLLPDLEMDAVVTDNFKGAYTATSHLTELGHERIAMIAGPQGVYSSDQRLAGFTRSLEQAGLAISQDLIFHGDFRKSSGYAAVHTLLQLPAPPTALFAGNNLMAMGALEAINERRLAIPDDLSFISFDDMDWYPLANPPITAVDQPAYDMGRAAASQLLNRLQATEESVDIDIITVETEFILRESTLNNV